MKQNTWERFSADDGKNQAGQRLKHNWSAVPYVFPPEYMEFLERFNGYCGMLGTSYVDLMRFEELKEYNEAYKMQEFFPGLVMIGSNGGGMGYAINQEGQFVTYDQCGDYIQVLADHFDDFVEYICTYDRDEDV